jgi:hypothetical protein
VFQTDIHPAARFGQGIFLDHATGLVVGETAAVQDDVRREAIERDDDNARFTGDVDHALALAVLALGDGHYDEVARLIRPVRGIANRFGGSHAQREVVDLTLIEAAQRDEQRDLVRALIAERVAAKPTSSSARGL